MTEYVCIYKQNNSFYAKSYFLSRNSPFNHFLTPLVFRILCLDSKLYFLKRFSLFVLRNERKKSLKNNK